MHHLARFIGSLVRRAAAKSAPAADDAGLVSSTSGRSRKTRTGQKKLSAPAKPAIAVEGNVLRKTEAAPEPALGMDSADRRRSQRHAQSATGWLSNATGTGLTSGRTVSICDLSLHGVGFTTQRACHIGDRHWILITQGHLRLSTRVRIISIQQREEGDGWNVGAEFF